MTSQAELGHLTVVSPSTPLLTSISSASIDRVSDSLTSSVSLIQCTPQEKNNVKQNRLQMMKRNISSLSETLNRLSEVQRTSREQEGMKVGIQKDDHQVRKSIIPQTTSHSSSAL